MSRSMMNQSQMRTKIRTGSPKKNAACRSFSNMNGGISPGFVIACQKRNTATRTSSCQSRRVRGAGFRWFHMRAGTGVSGRQLLLRVPLQDLFAQHVPDRLVQVDEAGRDAHLGDVARPREIDREL